MFNKFCVKVKKRSKDLFLISHKFFIKSSNKHFNTIFFLIFQLLVFFSLCNRMHLSSTICLINVRFVHLNLYLEIETKSLKVIEQIFTLSLAKILRYIFEEFLNLSISQIFCYITNIHFTLFFKSVDRFKKNQSFLCVYICFISHGI